jgi:hypothetical protein
MAKDTPQVPGPGKIPRKDVSTPTVSKATNGSSVRVHRTYPTGFKPLTPEEEAWRKANVPLITKPRGRLRSIPSQWKNWRYLPKVGNQKVGSCSAWGTGYYYKTYQEAREHGWENPDPDVNPDRACSPMFLYTLCNAGVDNGSNPVLIAQTIVQFGAAIWEAMPESFSTSEWPSNANIYISGFPWRGQSVSEIDITTDTGILALKEHLATGDPASIAIWIGSNLFSYPLCDGMDNDVYYQATGYTAGHDLCVIGYDDNKEYNDGTGTKKGAFLLVNSWGDWGITDPDVGTTGFVWMSYDLIRTRCYGTAVIMEDRIGYEPNTWAVFGFEHGRRLELSVGFIAGEKDNPNGTVNANPPTKGMAGFDGQMAIDLTDVASQGGGSYWLSAFDATVGTLDGDFTGTIDYLALCHPGQAPIECPDVPIKTKNMEYVTINVDDLDVPTTSTFSNAGPLCSANAWGDIDGDGDKDLLIVGQKSYEGGRANIFRNEGNLSFAAIACPITASSYGSVALGDADNDGDLDLVASGEIINEGSDASLFTRLYKNDGSGNFSEMDIALPVNAEGSLNWVDYDNDGDLDLDICGYASTAWVFGHVLYENHGNWSFSDSGISMPTAGHSTAWADYDRDGRMDFILWGGHYDSTVVYRNTGTGFEAAQTFDASFGARPVWGDIDGDGWLDIVMNAMTGTWPNENYRIAVYRNNQAGQFEDTGLTIAAPIWGTYLTKDYDNDGRADITISGAPYTNWHLGYNKVVRVLHNNDDDTFSNIGFDVTGITGTPSETGSGQNLDWVDADGDGDLDLYTAGCGPQDAEIPFEGICKIYPSLFNNPSSATSFNTAPTSPTDFSATSTGAGSGSYRLAWSGASDAQTTTPTLTYDVRVGTAPGGQNVHSGVRSNPFVPASKEDTNSGLLLLERLPAGDYYWSVRTVDGVGATSAWSAEQTFTSDGPVRGDLNGDGVVDAADIVLCSKMVAGTLTPDVTKADLDEDGLVTSKDLEVLSKIILNADGATGFRPATWGEIGPGGGTIETPDMKIIVPSGAFDSSADLTIGVSDDEKPFGNAQIAPTYRIAGLPETIDKPIQVRVKPSAMPSGSVYAMSGEEVFVPSLRGMAKANRIMEATKDSSGYVNFEIPATDDTGTSTSVSAKRRESRADGTWTSDYTVLAGYSRYDTAHFRIYVPTADTGENVENLGTYLETAYNLFSNSSIGLSYSRRSCWPMEVTCKSLDSTVYGYAASSRLGNNYGYMEFNTKHLGNALEMRVTATHEFFHIVQGLYDPRNRISKAQFQSANLWLDEAMAVWSEELTAGVTGYKSTVYTGSEDAPFNGIALGAKSDGLAASHGYGMASVIKYLVQRQGQGIVKDIYDRMYSGKQAAYAVLQSSPDPILMTWWGSFFQQFFAQAIYPANAFQLSGTGTTYRIRTKDDTGTTIKGSVPDLGAKTNRIQLAYPNLSADASMSFKLTGDVSTDLSLYKLNPSRSVNAATFIGRAAHDPTDTKIATFTLDNLKSIQDQSCWILMLVENSRTNDPYMGQLPYTLNCAITQNTHTLQPTTIPINWLWFNMKPITFPTFVTSGVLSGEGMTNVTDSPIQGAGVTMQDVTAQITQPRPQTFTLKFNCALSGDSDITYGEGMEKMTFLGISGYRFEYNYNASTDTYDKQLESDTGDFTFAFDPGLEYFCGYVRVVYSIRTDGLMNGSVISTRTDEVDYPVGMFVLWP